MEAYYRILGLRDGATLEEIQKAYKLYASKFHPNKHGGDDFFYERFKEIQEAYKHLTENLNQNDDDKISHQLPLNKKPNHSNQSINDKYKDLWKDNKRVYRHDYGLIKQDETCGYDINRGNNRIPSMPKKYFGWAILAIFLFWPIGIVAIIKSNKVQSLYYAGDYEGAQKASNAAKTWAIVALMSFIIGILSNIIFIMTYFL